MPKSINFSRLFLVRKKRRSSKKRGKVDWQPAPDIHARVLRLVHQLNIEWVSIANVSTLRSHFSNTRAYARIWGLSRVWQMVLEAKPHYIIEVISERFDKLSDSDKDRILLHEIAHIPKNFSGSLVAHTRRGKGTFHDKLEGLLAQYHKNKA